MVFKLYNTDINIHLPFKFRLGIQTLGAFLLLFIFLFNYLKLQGQKTPSNLLQYGLEDGLSQVTINDMVLDDSGFLWIGTQEGLNRFDGTLFKHFKYSKKDSTGLSGNFITKLFKDSRGYIWIGTARNGLNFYDPSKNIIKKVISPEIDLTNSSVNGIIEGPKSKIWVAFEKEGVLALDPQNYEGALKVDSTIQINGSEILAIYKDSKEKVWAAYPDHIRTLNSKNEIVIPFHHRVMSLIRVDDKLFIGSENGLFEYDIKSQNTKKVILEKYGEIETGFVSSIIEYDINSLWIGTGNGLYLYNYKKNKVLNKLHKSDRENNGLSNGTVQSLLRNGQNQLFVGTANGLNMLCFVPSFFKNISKDIKGKHFSTLLNDNVVFSIFKDHNNFWIGTSDGGLNLILEDRAYYFQEDLNQTHSIAGGTIRGIAKDIINNRMWIASTRGLSIIDLNTFDPVNPKFISLRHDTENPNSISSNFIRDIALDKKGILWAATASAGIFSIGYDSNDTFQIKKYVHDSSDSSSLASNNTYKITIDKENGIWVGTDSGLCYLPNNKKTDTILSWKRFKNKQSDKSIDENVIYDILIDSQDKIWTGSRGGLSVLSDDGKFESWHHQNQFPNDVVYSLLEDKQGHIWMATNQGLVRFNPERNEFSHYSNKDGIQSIEFNLHAKFKDELGNLYFGGLRGVTFFSPEHLDKLDIPQPVYLYELRIKESIQKVTDNTQNVSQSSLNSLHFNYNDFPFYLKFSTLDFRTNKNTALAYKLFPLDQEWNPIRNEEIQFLNLPPGSYSLMVNGLSRGKQWKSEPIVMNIKILPPWWSSWWAYIIYFLILITLFYLFYWFLLTKKLAVNENIRLKELREFRTNLFTNITHEFKTPLMIISGLTENLKDQIASKPKAKQNSHLDVIDRNTTHLLDLVKDILDLTKLEVKEEKLELKQSEIVSFIKYIFDSFSNMAKEKEIQFILNDEVQSLIMDFDSEKLSKVVSNLLSNAIKFTPRQGKIVIQLKKTEKKETHFFQLDVIDDGIGMSKKDLKQVFDRFYKSKNAKSINSIGSGIGLALTRELVHLMHGCIKVKSTLNVGSRFYVRLPITNKSPVSEIYLDHIKPPKIHNTTQIFYSNKNKIVGTKNPLILIVEDNPDVQFYLTACLSEYFQLIYAENGKIGFAMARDYIPDMVISDVMMPKKTGIEMCKELKNDLRTDHIPVILLTAKTQDKWRMKGLSCGADSYLTKPFIKEELLIIIEQLILKKNKLVKKFNTEYSSLIDKNRSNKNQNKFIDKTIHLILKNLDHSDYGPPDLAKDLCLSESQVYRKLKAITDKPTSLFIRSIRLEEARNMLEISDKTISEISVDTGFNDPSWFSRAFKEAYGHSPSDHLKKN